MYKPRISKKFMFAFSKFLKLFFIACMALSGIQFYFYNDQYSVKNYKLFNNKKRFGMQSNNKSSIPKRFNYIFTVTVTTKSSFFFLFSICFHSGIYSFVLCKEYYFQELFIRFTHIRVGMQLST